MAKKREEQAAADELLAPDPFLERARSAADWLQKNIRVVVGVGVAVLAGIVIVDLLRDSSESDAATVTRDLSAAIEAYQKATDLPTILTTTVAAKVDKGYQDALTQLESFRSKNPNFAGARLARLYEAELLRRLRRNADAATAYQEYLSKATDADPLLFLALEGMGYALEDDAKLDEALAQFDALAQRQPFLKDTALRHKGRVLEKKGDNAGAKAAYQAIVDMEPASSLKSFAEDRVRALAP